MDCATATASYCLGVTSMAAMLPLREIERMRAFCRIVSLKRRSSTDATSTTSTSSPGMPMNAPGATATLAARMPGRSADARNSGWPETSSDAIGRGSPALTPAVSRAPASWDRPICSRPCTK